MIDFIGDIHGHAEELEALLLHLGYRERQGCYRHSDPDRRVVFLGDIIDRGPQQMRAIDVVRRMHDAGVADVIMGNHEHNAIGWLMTNEHGEPLRAHTPKNRHQHQAFLDAVSEGSALHLDVVRWFETLPWLIDGDGFRAVHACWQPEAVKSVIERTGGSAVPTAADLHKSLTKGEQLYAASDDIMRGVEVDLPDGRQYADNSGHMRSSARVRWWTDGPMTYRGNTIVSDAISAELPDEPLPGSATVTSDDERPVFFGHYWMQGDPHLVSPKAACLDFSVAMGGYLCSYRWEGEETLDPNNLTSVRTRTVALAI